MPEIIIFILGVCLGGGAVWFVRQKQMESIQYSQEQLKSAFGNLSKEALDANIETFLILAETRFNDLLGQSDEQLGKKKELIDSTLKEMKSNLKNLDENTVALKSQMELSRKSVGELTDTTSELRQILSSSQKRGQWGERIVKDILDYIGLVEGINYKEQTQAGTDRPDFTFFLPDGKSLNMDVKFPLDRYKNFIAAENDVEKESEKKAFLKDVRNRIKEVSKRSYIDPGGGTVDYVLLLVPNEGIYAFLNQEDTNIIDFSLKQKIMLCSPITLYAILSLIRQAVSNFAMEQKAGEMQSLVGIFKKQWAEFIEQMDRFENTLGTLNAHYERLKTTRRNQLEKPMKKIDSLELGEQKEIKEIEE